MSQKNASRDSEILRAPQAAWKRGASAGYHVARSAEEAEVAEVAEVAEEEKKKEEEEEEKEECAVQQS